MSQEPLFGHLGPQLEACFASALDDWLTYHKRRGSLEDTVTELVPGVKIEAQLRTARAGLVVVTIQARNRHDHASYPYVLHATPFSAFKAAVLG